MKIILKENIEKLGFADEILTVKNGYARNYLIPQEMAMYATKSNITRIEYQVEKSKELEAEKVKKLQKVADKLDKLTLKFELKVGDEDKLFGSVTVQMIINELLEQGYNVEKKDVAIPEAIKTIGSHYANIYLHKEVSCQVKVKVKELKE